MPDIDDFYPPITYDWIWWLVLPLFIALLVAWILFSKWLARRSLRPKPVGDAPPPPLFVADATAAQKALDRIDAVARRVEAQEQTVRDAHIELSEIVREYAFRRTGVDARTMTLDELRESELLAVADTVAGYYPIAFAPDETEGVGEAVRSARGVVAVWS